MYINICNPWVQNCITCNYVVVMSIDIPLWRLTSQLTVKPYQLSTLRIHIMSYQYIAFSSLVTQWFELPQGTSYFWKCSVYFLRSCQYKSPWWFFWQETKKTALSSETVRDQHHMKWQGHFKEAQEFEKCYGNFSARFWNHAKNKSHWPVL